MLHIEQIFFSLKLIYGYFVLNSRFPNYNNEGTKIMLE
jgi:hypothetical protein